MNYKYKWILFDADGTLFNYDKSEQHALYKAFKNYGVDFNSVYLAQYRQINHFLWGELEKGKINSEKLRVERFEILLKEINCNLNAKLLSDSYLNELSQTDFMLEGAIEILEFLFGKVNLAIITNGIKFVQEGRLKKSKIEKYFKEIIISEDVKIAKPDKLFFDYTLEKINFKNKSEILIVGDSLTSDIQGGINSDIDTCWFNPNKNGNILSFNPTFEIVNLSEIEKIISNN
ncbi:MAG: YjjG family noncanonical pyrimidine nucleotidase [Bacteroidales bacterium]|nr:YjjG family noncanonical pyrimidine nucleotidase [Bacteroidales bacterium]MBN2758841.1 YjjG family noncanonical pyrimidine nucleotidase [Bacteroidales bacterium]